MASKTTSETCEAFYVDPAKVERIKGSVIGAVESVDLAEIFKVLGDPTRVKIISALSTEELCVCDIACLLGMEVSAVSHQLRILRQHRLVKHRKAGKFVYYSLDDDHIVRLFAEGLEHLQE